MRLMIILNTMISCYSVLTLEQYSKSTQYISCEHADSNNSTYIDNNLRLDKNLIMTDLIYITLSHMHQYTKCYTRLTGFIYLGRNVPDDMLPQNINRFGIITRDMLLQTKEILVQLLTQTILSKYRFLHDLILLSKIRHDIEPQQQPKIFTQDEAIEYNSDGVFQLPHIDVERYSIDDLHDDTRVDFNILHNYAQQKIILPSTDPDILYIAACNHLNTDAFIDMIQTWLAKMHYYLCVDTFDVVLLRAVKNFVYDVRHHTYRNLISIRLQVSFVNPSDASQSSWFYKYYKQCCKFTFENILDITNIPLCTVRPMNYNILTTDAKFNPTDIERFTYGLLYTTLQMHLAAKH